MLSRQGFYKTRSWQVKRARQLREHLNCAMCGQPATDADHITLLGEGGDPNGPLQSLCRPCHAKKTAAEGGRAAKAKRPGYSR